MNYAPSMIIEFDPVTFQVVDVKFNAASEKAFDRLREILVEGVNGAVKNDRQI